MASIYIDENKTVQIDCSAALWSSEDWHNLKDKFTNTLCDADWIIENERYLIVVEYKNACIRGAKKSKNFKPLSKIDNLVSKYLDTLHYLNILDKHKPRQYVCVLEYEASEGTSRGLMREKLKNRLFSLQEADWAKAKLIDSVLVLSVEEWNSHAEYSRFPILPIAEPKKTTE